MQSHLSNNRIEELLGKVFSSADFDRQQDTTIVVYDIPFLRERIRSVARAFPENAMHTIAIKANSLPGILEEVKDQGFGLEAASWGELKIAEQSGYPPDKIVFDSPVKTYDELEYALKKGIHLNADSLMELERIAKLKEQIKSRSNIGLRINPQVGVGNISITSVAGNYSKFGVPMQERRQAIIQAYEKYPWLNGIHLHTGSQGCEPEMLVDGVRHVFELAQEIQQKTSQQIVYFDIGGGLPVSYHRKTEAYSMQYYADLLRESCPELFNGRYQLITEFGRYIHANAGFVASRVEYVKHDNGINTAMIHVGANMFIREAYHPQQWKHEFSLADPQGRLKPGETENPWIVAGPLCFAGDMIARNISLPSAKEGDYIIVHDSGGYVLAMWSEYNSRKKPRAFGVKENGKVLMLS
ncbi:MAG: diaminopimelate decarboxylase [Bacteroidota bacterium]